MTDLTDRMRTCAAYIMGTPRDEKSILFDEENILLNDAAKLLVEAAAELDLYDMQKPPAEEPQPMEILPARPAALQLPPGAGQWIGDDLKPIPNAPRSRNACPKCDSRAGKTVKARNETIWLECAVCGYAWIAR